jgi:nephrocystin-3
MSQMKRELRLFISSTFRDLIEEREELLKKVFPLIRHTCRQRGVDFVEIDLRWGLTEQDAALGNVVRTCLEEIDRCRPFFLGILGSRYGWSPSFIEIQKDPELLSRYPWIEEAAVEGASILDLEFSHALIRHASEVGSFVYRREEDWRDEDGERLAQLASRIEATGVDIRTFESVDALGRLVLEDLMRAINHYWPEVATDDFLEHERREQAAFASTRRKAYIANANALKHLTAHVAPSAKPLLITAPSGQGKSALVAYWSDFIKRKQPEAIVLTHFVGLSTAGSGAPAILRHFVEELRAQLGTSEEKLPVESVESEFRIWLSRVTDRPLVFIIDAVNQLDEQWHSMDWLPETERENIHWIVSTTGGTTREALQKRDWDIYYLGELETKEREALVIRFLGDFRKVLSPAQLERIVHSENSASPLFLRTLLEELRLFGNYEALDQVIDEYLAVPDTAGLFQKVLARMQEDFGGLRVREVLTLIWGARKGLTELELVEITGIAKPKLTKFLLALEYQLLPRGGFITLFHDYLAEAIERAYLPSHEHKKKLHERLAKYFDEKELNERNAYELLWQLAQAGRLDRVRKLLVSPLHFRFFMTDERKWEYLRYWRMIDEDRELALELAGHLRNAAEQSYSHEEERIEQVSVGASFLHEIGQPQLALDLAEFAEAKLAELPDAFKSLRIQLLGIKGQAYQALSDYPKAEEAFNEQIREAEKSEGSESFLVVDAMENLASVCYARGSFEKAQYILESSANILERLNAKPRLTEALLSLASVYYGRTMYEVAERTVLKSFALISDMHRPDFMLSAHNSLGNIQLKLGKREASLKSLERAYSIACDFYGATHSASINSLNNLGFAKWMAGDLQSAEADMRVALCTAERSLGQNNMLVADIANNLASIEIELGRQQEGEQYVRKAAAIVDAILVPSDSRVSRVKVSLACILVRTGKLDEARGLFTEHLARFSEQLPGDNPEVLKANRYLNSLDRAQSITEAV